jgi:hypothetical protein
MYNVISNTIQNELSLPIFSVNQMLALIILNKIGIAKGSIILILMFL